MMGESIRDLFVLGENESSLACRKVFFCLLKMGMKNHNKALVNYLNRTIYNNKKYYPK